MVSATCGLTKGLTVFKNWIPAAVMVAAATVSAPVFANAEAEALVRRISSDVLDTAKADPSIQAGDINKIIALVDAKVMPSVNFEAMTRSAVGPQWRGASPEQRSKLQAEFKTLLVRVYSGALTQLKDQTVEITRSLPVPGGSQVVVQSQVKGSGEPIKLDYRMDKTADGWKIIDVNVGGIWLVTSYRSQFAQELNAGGLDGLLAKLVERNKAAAR
jgi:phospholipid transport system substrate-binding protein